jgi:hypothetical protein
LLRQRHVSNGSSVVVWKDEVGFEDVLNQNLGYK